MFVSPSSAWLPIATVSWEKAFQNKFPGHKVDAILGSPPGLQSKQRNSPEDPSHGDRATPIRILRRTQQSRSGSAPSRGCGEKELGRSWPILEHVGSLANPVPPSSRFMPIAPELNLNDIDMGRKPSILRRNTCSVLCILHYPALKALDRSVSVSALARKTYTSLVGAPQCPSLCLPAQRPSQFLALPQDSIIAQNGFGSVAV